MVRFNLESPDKKEKLHTEQKQQISYRMYVLIVLFLIGFISVGVKLFIIQIRDKDIARNKATNQYESKKFIKPQRGLIYDRNRFILASSTYDLCIAADPSILKKRDSVALFLSKIFAKDKSYYLEKFEDTTIHYIELEKHVPSKFEHYFSNDNKSGLIKKREPLRIYNFHSLAGQVIGYTSLENVGLCGIELAMNDELTGKEGYIVYQCDADRNLRPEVDYPKKDPVNGQSVVLSLDQTFQSIAEEELEKGVKNNKAVAGSCLVLQPRTGEVLAMANYPFIELQDRKKYDPGAERNRLITDLFEPGSTFKIVTASAAINENTISPDEKIDTQNGTYEYSPNEKVITDTRAYGKLTLKEAIQHSSNIFMAKLALRLGKEKLFTYARKFGFGVPTSIELRGEITGELIKPGKMKLSDQVYLSFGYQINVNALQVASAYSAIANDGILMQPLIKKWLLDENGNIVQEFVPRMVRRVVSSSTAGTMKEYLESVVQNGTARNARIEGMRIAGKTGTAQKWINGHYSKKSYISSFVGFFPVDNPKILILVLLDSPDKSIGYTGGTVAAPIFREIAIRIMNASNEFAQEPQAHLITHQLHNLSRVPDICGLKINIAEKVLHAHGIQINTAGSGEVIFKQEPAKDSIIHRGSIVRAILGQKTSLASDNVITIPDVKGMTIRQAMALLKSMKIETVISGSGVVRDQYPSPGERVLLRSVCALICNTTKNPTANLY